MTCHDTKKRRISDTDTNINADTNSDTDTKKDADTNSVTIMMISHFGICFM